MNVATTDSIVIQWQARGDVTMGIHDIPYGAGNPGTLNPVTLEITQGAKTETRHLGPDDTIVMALPSTGDLVIQMTGDNQSERLRYIRFVARRFHKDSMKDRQITISPPGAFQDRIGFTRHIHGDTLVSEGPVKADRWTDTDQIANVSDSSGNDVIVTHAGVTSTISSGGVPSNAFNGKPVNGWWSLRRLLTPEEKADQTKIPKSLTIYITIKRR